MVPDLQMIVLTLTFCSVMSKQIVVPPGQNTLHKYVNSAASGDTLLLQKGLHQLSSSLNLGNTNTNLTFIGDEATISGGVEVTTWTMNQSNGFFEAAVPAGVNVSDIGQRMQMWRGSNRLVLARSPTLKYAHAESTMIMFNGDDIKPNYYDFANVHLVLFESWTASLHRMTHVDSTNHTAFLASSYNSQWANTASGSRYYVENCLEELDEVNEFYVDAIRQVVMVKLGSGDDPNKGEPFTMATIQELIRVEGNATFAAGHVGFSGINFAHTSVDGSGILTGASMQSADFLTTATIHVVFAKDVVLDQCTISATGGYAVWFEQGTFDCALTRSSVTDSAAGAVRLGRGHIVDSIEKPECEGHTIADNVLTDGGFVWQEGCGVFAQNVGNCTITHNEIGRFRYTGVSTGWTWGYGPTIVHDIITSYNHIHDIGMGYLSDMGCVYTLGHQPGSMIHNNYCSDVQSYNYGGWAYYTDEGSRDEVFQNNIATRTKCAGHHQHYGTDNNLINNIYYNVNIGDVPTPGRKEILMTDCDASIRASTHKRPSTCKPDTNPTTGCCCYPGCDQGKCSSFHMENNIVFVPENSVSGFVTTSFNLGLDNFTFDKNLYFAVSRNLSAPLFNMTGTAMGEDFASWQQHQKDVNSLVADPQFSNSSDFSLKATSPAFGLGFKAIDTSSIGPRHPLIGASHAQAAQSDLSLDKQLAELKGFGLTTN